MRKLDKKNTNTNNSPRKKSKCQRNIFELQVIRWKKSDKQQQQKTVDTTKMLSRL